MKVYLLVNSHGHPDPHSSGGQLGDVTEILPITEKDSDIGILTLKYFFPIIKDLKIPCGDGEKDASGTFTLSPKGIGWNCNTCKFNDADLCERIKYLRSEFDQGTIENPPRLLRKRIHMVDLGGILSPSDMATATKVNKTKQDEEEIMDWAKRSDALSIAILKKEEKK
jgi:hypothetical protein